VTPPLPPLPTRVGHAAWGENFLFGHAVGRELVGSETYTGLVALAVRGQRPTAEECAVLDDIAAAMIAADPRIWPLKLIRVISSYGSTLPALAASKLCVERAMIGHWTSGAAADRLVALLDAVAGDVDDAGAVGREVERALAAGERWTGFGVPFREQDERFLALRRALERRDRAKLPFFRLSETLASVMLELKGLRPNIGTGVAAACLDLGYAPREIEVLALALGQTDYLANAVEGAAQMPEVLRVLPREVIRYVGPGPRESARSKLRNNR
jgi:hypothetical protein